MSNGDPRSDGGVRGCSFWASRGGVSLGADVADGLRSTREAQCAYRRVGAHVHHRVPSCGTTWAKHVVAVSRGDVEVLTNEPSDSRRCSRCYSDESYRRHPL